MTAEMHKSRKKVELYMKLLIAEDDNRLLKSLTHIFEMNRYVVDGVGTGTEALEYAKTGAYDGIILDIMMPELDGISVLEKLRREGNETPVLLLTARTEVEQRVEGLDAGADDYLTKPFAMSELLARVRAMLRRRSSYVPELLEYEGMVLNCSTYELEWQGQHQTVSGKEFQIMEMLMQRQGQIIATEQLLTRIWGWESEVDTSVAWVHISNLRKKLNGIEAPVTIRFVRGAGYKLESIRL